MQCCRSISTSNGSKQSHWRKTGPFLGLPARQTANQALTQLKIELTGLKDAMKMQEKSKQ
jgi:hypothetical protein